MPIFSVLLLTAYTQTSANYYHFVCECLSRFLLLEPELQADPSLRLLAPTSEPFMLPLYSMLGFDTMRIVPYKYVEDLFSVY